MGRTAGRDERFESGNRGGTEQRQGWGRGEPHGYSRRQLTHDLPFRPQGSQGVMRRLGSGAGLPCACADIRLRQRPATGQEPALCVMDGQAHWQRPVQTGRCTSSGRIVWHGAQACRCCAGLQGGCTRTGGAVTLTCPRPSFSLPAAGQSAALRACSIRHDGPCRSGRMAAWQSRSGMASTSAASARHCV